MGILQLNVENFRSLKNVEWKPGSLNIVIGPNASGKSNLLKALQFISVSADGKLEDYTSNQGGIKRILWDGSATFLLMTVQVPDITADPFSEDRLLYMFDLISTNMSTVGTVSHELLTPNYQYNRFGIEYPVDDIDTDRHLILKQNNSSKIASSSGHLFPVPLGHVPMNETLLSQVTLRDNEYVYQLGNDLRHWTVYERLRTDSHSEVRLPAGMRYERYLGATGQNFVNFLHTSYVSNKRFEELIDEGMSAAFGDEFEKLTFPPVADNLFQMKLRWRSLSSATADISDGTLNFLFILAALAQPEPPPIIAFDEPETSLHPRMFGIIAEYAAEAAKKTQVIFTTHSPSFLDAFTSAKPTVTVAQNVNGETKLAIPDEDRLNHWLKNYTLGEMFLSNDLENLVEV